VADPPVEPAVHQLLALVDIQQLGGIGILKNGGVEQHISKAG